MNNMIIYFVISLLTGTISYLASSNLYLAISITSVFLFYFLFYFDKSTKRKKLRISKFHEMYNFINTFIITLSVKDSLPASFESASINVSKNFKEELESISHLNEEEKLEYLKSYFDFDIYYVFLNVLHLYLEQGGDVLDMFSLVLKKARSVEDYISKASSLGKRKISEISILWMFSLGILVFIRFALTQFFNTLVKTPFFLGAIGFIFLFFLISIEISRRSILSLNVKGVDM